MIKLHLTLGSGLCAGALLLTMCKGADSTVSNPASGAGNAGIASGAGATASGTGGHIASSGAAGSVGGAGSGVGTSGGGGATAGGTAAGGSGVGGETTMVSKRAACVAYATASCNKSQTCDGRSGGDCFYHHNFDCPDVLFSVGSTRTVEGVLACSDEIAAFPCDQWRLGFRPACVTPGTLQDGDPCLYPSQCASLQCSSDSSASCGQCTTPIAQGQPCAASPDGCAPGLVCDTTNTCVPLTLDPVQAHADPPPLPEGSACMATDPCAAGTQCVAPVGETVGTCESGGAVDTPCKQTLLPVSPYGYCAEGLYCIEQICRAQPALGGACGLVAGHGCSEGAWCNEQTSLCEAPLALGASCSFPDQCLSGQCRSPANNYDPCVGGTDTDCVCSRQRTEGQDCVAGVDLCEQGTECANGVCMGVDSLHLFEAACIAR